MNGIGLNPWRSLRFLSWGGGAILGQNLSWNFNELHVMHAFYPFRPRPPPHLRWVGPLRVGRGLNPWRSLRFLSWGGGAILGQNLSWNFNELHVMHAFCPFRPRPPPRLRRVGPLRVGRGLNPNAVQLGCNLLKS